MLLRKMILTVLVLNVFLIGAQGGNKSTPKDILANALKFTMNAKFKATDLKINGKDTKQTIYRMVTPDDNMLLQRDDARSCVTIINKEGTFCWRKENGAVLGDTVIKLTGSLSRNNVFRFMRLAVYYSRLDMGEYSIAEVNRNKIPCYRIQVKYPNDDASLAKLTKRKLETLDKERVKGTIAAMTFWIGKEKPFIYACDYYGFHGKKIMSISWNVELGAVIDENLFKLPERTTIVTAKNSEEINKIMREKYSCSNLLKWRKSRKNKK